MGKLDKFLLALLILVAGISRLWHISQYLTFLGDEGRDITVIRDIIKGHKYTLIGPGTSIGNMYLGPWYYYLMIPAVGLTNFSPVGPALMIAGFGIATVILLWWISRCWLGNAPSWMISFLYALSPTVIFYSRSSWNPNIMPFFSLLSIYSVWAVYRYHKYSYLPILGFSYAMVLNSHYLGLLLLPVILFYLYKSKISIIHNSLFVILFLFMMSPLVLFDLRHNWQNFQAIKTFFTVRQQTVNLQPQKSLPNLWPLYTQINSSLLLAKQDKFSPYLSFLILISLIYYFKKYKLIIFWLVTGLIGLGLYKQHIYDHYFGFLFPVVFLSLGLAFKLIGQKLSWVLFIFLLIINLFKNPLLSEPNNQLWRTRQIAGFINKDSHSSYNLALISNHNYDASYRYFLNTNYKTLHEQITDQLYVICETEPCEPINNPLWEIAGFGWSKIDNTWNFPWGVKLFRLIHNPSGQS